MKAVLHLKFIVLYIIFGFLCVFTTATLTTELITERLEKDTSQTLYREATMIADNYLPSYFSNESSSWAVHSQLSAMKTYLNSSLWFVEKDGTMITSANLKDTTAPQSVNNFDPAEIGSNQYMIGTYHNYFQEDMITVMAPVTQGFYTKGYLIIHSPVSLINERCRTLMVPVYISLGVIFLLSFIFLLGFHFFVHRPLLLITEAAKQYDHKKTQCGSHCLCSSLDRMLRRKKQYTDRSGSYLYHESGFPEESGQVQPAYYVIISTNGGPCLHFFRQPLVFFDS